MEGALKYCKCEHLEAYHAPRPLYYGAKEMGTGCAFCACAAFEGAYDEPQGGLLTEPEFSEGRARLGLPPLHVH